jgi:hypothetical protein
MAKKSNVHPDHYKTAGREPVGQGLVQELEKQALKTAQSEEQLRSERMRKRKFRTPKTSNETSEVGIPGAKAKRKKTMVRTSPEPAKQTNRQMSQKTGKRSGAQKSQNARYGTEAMPAAQPVEGAFGREPTQRNRRKAT